MRRTAGPAASRLLWSWLLTAWVVMTMTGRAQAPPQTTEPPLPILLTNAQQIVALGSNVPPNRYQARIAAVVHYISPASRRLYVQSGDLGVQVNLATTTAAFQLGHRLEISGTVLGGDPSVRLGKARAVVLGEGPLPEPRLFSIHELVRGDHPYRHVHVRGVVRDMTAATNGVNLLLTQGNYPFEVILQTDHVPLPLEWLDADLEITGFSVLGYNAGTRRPTGIKIYASGTNQVRVLQPGIPNRFEGRPLLTIAEVEKLPPNLKARYRVAGTVTVHRPGVAYFLDDGTGALHVDQSMRFLAAAEGVQRIEREPQIRLRPGERVEVIGAKFNFFSRAPSFQATEYRRSGKGVPIQPIRVAVPDLVAGRHAGRLVTLKAQLLDYRIWGNSSLRHNMTATLRHESDVFQALWEGDAPVEWKLEAEGHVEVTGVNDAEGSPQGNRTSFKLLLRSPADIIPTEPPPFWTRTEFRRVALAAGGVAGLAGCWIVVLRWQMKRLEDRIAARSRELRASEARKTAVLETALDSILSMDRHGQIIDINPAAERTFGYTRDEAIGQEMAQLIIPAAHRDSYRAGLRAGVHAGADTMIGRRIEIPAMRRNGEEFPVEMALARIETGDGPIFTAHIQDITERKRAEAERERALAHEKELSELKSRFVSMVSHEFRTPLGIITSSAEILDAYLDRLSVEERKSNLRDITDATRHMAGMMEEVLLLGRVEAGKLACTPAPIDLDAFCRRLVDEMASVTGRRCPIQVEVPADLAPAAADENLLRHIFTNLLGNAAKYSPPGSPVEWRVEARGALALFSVRDHGIGIPESDTRQIFQAFHRGVNVGEAPGTGLGLTIVKRCVELHGGTITFQSKETRGTTFVVALPLFPNSPAPPGLHHASQST